jgi:hypothetical protein
VANVSDGFTTPVLGVMDYSFGNFKLNITAPLVRVDGGLQREATRTPADWELVVGSYNVENLDPGDGGAFARHAGLIVGNLRSPELLAIEEVQDNDGATDSAVTDASVAAVVPRWPHTCPDARVGSHPDHPHLSVREPPKLCVTQRSVISPSRLGALPPLGSGAAAPGGALRVIDAAARPSSCRTCGPRRLRRQPQA